ncbi:hypothetical protein [Brachybacterium sp. UMB0905]|uniref:hypothetical protein n=1 Tax=Brachybacterium sp. UMB0905 TaxID=2069310 RepID=UPI000C80CE41|nr:hypothetical protein [Brachybacterium sp. UMB0905]PMC76050.1 hypothetical protein CJ197_05170 [Brachybacterium sp. UMB0905]
MAAAKENTKTRAWRAFDHIVHSAERDEGRPAPWTWKDGGPHYVPDTGTLCRLLGVPLALGATTTSGVPALALDVWLSYEMRRAGFDGDAVWPRSTHPRTLPRQIVPFLEALPSAAGRAARDRLLTRGSITGVSAASANILGKNYLKQVDVIMSDWQTGPELLISTKRMDSSYGKNAANRIEEAYGDAKNLRLRHPLAAHGFLLGLRSDIVQTSPTTADWLLDMMVKLGQEDDAYHATCVLLIDYADEISSPSDDGEPVVDTIEGTREVVPSEPAADPPDLLQELNTAIRTMHEEDRLIAALPPVSLIDEGVPAALSPRHFLTTLISHVLDVTPVTMHEQARRLRRAAAPARRQ